MNKETFIEYIDDNKYRIYNYWDNYKIELPDRINLLITYYQKDLLIEIEKLKACNFAYEKIIANSNFNTILEDNEDIEKQIKHRIKEKIKDLQENNNGDDYSTINVVNILKDLLGDKEDE